MTDQQAFSEWLDEIQESAAVQGDRATQDHCRAIRRMAFELSTAQREVEGQLKLQREMAALQDKIYPELERLRGIEQRAKNATHAAVVADMPALQAVWRAAHYILSGDAS